MRQELNDKVQQVISERVASGAEVGLQVAAYLHGELVVDTWAGLADEASGRLVDGDTLFTSWSTTKGFAATCLHILADRGQVAYDAPVARYWPEFAAHGKSAVTVGHALTHRAGVPYMPAGATPELLTDWDAMCAAIASHTPLWAAGTTVAYHAWTFGWIIGEIVRRVDGRPIAQFAQEELCQPLGMPDFYLGIPDAVEPRVAPLRQNLPPEEQANNVDELARRAMPPAVTSAAVANRPDVRRAAIPGGGGIMSARAIARHYAMLAQGGTLDGTTILAPERVETIRALQTDAHDFVLGSPNRKGLGYMLGGDPQQGGHLAMGRSAAAFGHGGYGGSLGFADPERGLSFGLTKTLMRLADEPNTTTAYVVAELIRESLE